MAGHIRQLMDVMSLKKHKYITRIDANNTHGYQVRICYQSSNITHSKMFSDNPYGGKRKALKAAIQFRDQIAKDLDIEHLLSIPHASRKQIPRRSYKTNSSGIIGVNFIRDYKDNYENYYYAVKYQENKKQRSICFSIKRYGEKEAFKLACKIRYEHAGKLYIYKNFKFPCKIPVPYEYID